MKACFTKAILLMGVLLLTACGGGKWETDYQFPGFERTQSLELLQADNGQIYVVGKATNTNPQSETFFVAAFSRNGNLLWDQALASVDESVNVQFGESIMSVDSQNNLYITLGSISLPMQVYKFNSGGELVDSWYPPVVTGAGSNDLEVGPDNQLYVFSSRAVFAYSLEGDLIWSSADNGFEPNYEYYYKPDAQNNIRFMDTGNILFFDRTMILVYDTNGELISTIAASDIGMTRIDEAEIVGETVFVNGFGFFIEEYAPVFDVQGLVGLDQNLSYKDTWPTKDFEFTYDMELGESAGRLCYSNNANDFYGDQWSEMRIYDADFSELVYGSSRPPELGEYHSWLKRKIVGATSGCYFAEYGNWFTAMDESRILRLDINGDLTQLTLFKNYRIVDFIVENSALIQVGNILDENNEPVGIKLARQPE